MKNGKKSIKALPVLWRHLAKLSSVLNKTDRAHAERLAEALKIHFLWRHKGHDAASDNGPLRDGYGADGTRLRAHEVTVFNVLMCAFWAPLCWVLDSGVRAGPCAGLLVPCLGPVLGALSGSCAALWVL